MVQVIAIERGHDGRQVREVGEKFDVDEARLQDGSTWFKPVEPDDSAAPKTPASKSKAKASGADLT